VAALLEPLSDADADGLSAREEHALDTHPLRPDSDFDGLDDGAEAALGTGILNPDTDGDGLRDGIDPDPLRAETDPAAVDGLVLADINGLPPGTPTGDSDGDGFPDWVEALAGTGGGSAWDTPLRPDGSSEWFPVTVTLLRDLQAPAVLTVGGRTLLLREAGSWTFWLREGEAWEVALWAAGPCRAELTVAAGGGFAAFQPDGPGAAAFAPGGADLPPGGPLAAGLLAQPAVSIFAPSAARVADGTACYHSDGKKSFAAEVRPPMRGTHLWELLFETETFPDAPHVSFAPLGERILELAFTAEGASAARTARLCVSRCALPEEEPPPWCGAHGCEDALCACDDPGAGPGRWCPFHGGEVRDCPAGLCPTHGVPPRDCPEGWCHLHGCWYAECPERWCHLHDCWWAESKGLHPWCGEDHCCHCVHLPPPDDGGGGGSSPGQDGDPLPEGGYGRGDRIVAAVNGNDSDNNLWPDWNDFALADPDPDLVLLAPLGPACCPCPRHGAAEEPGAELVEHSGRVALWWDWEKTLPFSGNITRLQHVFAEGLAPSPHPWADRLVWRWEDGDGNRYHATNRLTLLNVSVWPDANADGETLPAWWGADSMLLAQSPGRVWPVAAASNVLRKVLLAAEVGPGVPGELILRADGPVRVWAEASADGAPLLDPPGGVTVHTFPARFTERGVYVEATAPGDAELAFEFDGREEGGFSGRERPARFRAVAKQKIRAVRLRMAADGDGDNVLDFGNPADTNALFWVNDDCDLEKYNEGMWQEDDADPNDTAHQDWADDRIGNKTAPGEGACLRDLEDFAPVQFRIDGDLSDIPGVSFALRFENVTDGSPSVNLFEAVTHNTLYLSDTDAAARQVQKTKLLTVDFSSGQEVPFNPVFNHPDGKTACCVFEGANTGTGDLTLAVKWHGVEIGKASVRVEQHDISWFYDIWQAEVVSGDRWTVEVGATASHAQTKGYQPETDDVILFIHGWNMPQWEKRRWTETMFKRLWWQGYRGSVALFDWPTLHGFTGSWWWDLPVDSRHFDNSEFIAWRSSDALANLLQGLNTGGRLTVLAHSMGNVVMGEALKKYSGPQIHAYIASKAAVSAQYYDESIASSQPAPFNVFPYFQVLSTPDIMANYPFEYSTEPYLSGVLSKVNNGVNFFNKQDWALNIWKDNNAYKPDSLYSFGYTGSTNAMDYLNGNGEFYRDPLLPLNRQTLTLGIDETQRYWIFAYCAESRSVALGQAESLPDGFTGQWDLQTHMGLDGWHYSHSREFRSNVVAEHEYWAKVFEVMTEQTDPW
jgi:hypothetical protein